MDQARDIFRDPVRTQPPRREVRLCVFVLNLAPLREKKIIIFNL